ncbi:hypothetical protein RQP46_010262 [Phenoliferia psychrophenolica]
MTKGKRTRGSGNNGDAAKQAADVDRKAAAKAERNKWQKSRLEPTPTEFQVTRVLGLFIAALAKASDVEAGVLAALLVNSEVTRDLFVGMILHLEGKVDDPLIVTGAQLESAKTDSLYNLNHEVFYGRLIQAVSESNNLGLHGDRVKAHLKNRKKKLNLANDWGKMSLVAGRNIFVHTMQKDSLEAQKAAQGKTIWSDQSEDIILSRRLKRRKDLNKPHMHLILDIDLVQLNPLISFLNDPLRNPLVQLNTTEAALVNAVLDKATNPEKLDDSDEAGEILLFSRIDVENWGGWKQAARQMRRRTGVPYRNFHKKVKVGESETVLLLQQEEATLADFLLIIMGGAIPGLLKYLKATTKAANLAGCGVANVVCTVAAMKAFDARSHLELPRDPTFTSAICLGAKVDRQTPGGAYDFGLPAIDGGRGLVVESGPGCLMIWPGKVVMHGTSFAWTPYDQADVVYLRTADLEQPWTTVADVETDDGDVLRLRGGADGAMTRRCFNAPQGKWRQRSQL